MLAKAFQIDPSAVLAWPDRVYEDVVAYLAAESGEDAARRAGLRG